MTVLENLKSARETLLRDGWCQHEITNSEGQHCLIGTVLYTRGDIDLNTMGSLLKILRDDGFVGGPAHWNDTPGRTEQDVLKLLDKAIRRAECELA